MIKVLSILGTRPEAIKLAPVLLELQQHSEHITSCLCVTAQHRQMLDQVLRLFRLIPDYDLNVMQEAQSPTAVAATVLSKLEPILMVERPDWVLVQGDTTTLVAGALAAFYARVKIGHVEAGMRTYDKTQPFPEEGHRRIAAAIADLHFAPTQEAFNNLRREHIPAENILLTGNTAIDALHAITSLPYKVKDGPLAGIPWEKRIILVTTHRRENQGQPLEAICEALQEIALSYQQSVHIVYSVHMNPRIWEPVHRKLGDTAGITLVSPLDYLSFTHLLKRCYLVLTDSGGLQAEVPGLGKPLLVLRNTTEYMEAVEAGTSKLVGFNRQCIVEETKRLLEDSDAYKKMAQVTTFYGDGQAAKRIVTALIEYDGTASYGMKSPSM